jgi:hypothetical protein
VPGYADWDDDARELFIETLALSPIPIADMDERVQDYFYDGFISVDVGREERQEARLDFFYEIELDKSQFDWAEWREMHGYGL